MWEVALPTDEREELRAAVRSHLVRLTQHWADQAVVAVEQVTG
jgi:hypothetical protein